MCNQQTGWLTGRLMERLMDTIQHTTPYESVKGRAAPFARLLSCLPLFLVLSFRCFLAQWLWQQPLSIHTHTQKADNGNYQSTPAAILIPQTYQWPFSVHKHTSGHSQSTDTPVAILSPQLHQHPPATPASSSSCQPQQQHTPPGGAATSFLPFGTLSLDLLAGFGCK